MNSNKAMYENILNYENSKGDITYLINLKNMLIDNIKEENAKNTGNKKKLTIVKNVLKDQEKKFKKYGRANLYGYSMYNDNYAFTDGYRIVISKDSFDYPVLDSPLKIDTIMQCDKKNTFSIDRADLKNFIDLNNLTRSGKNQKPYVFYVDGKKCAVNPFYMLDSIDFTGLNTFYVDLDISYLEKCNVRPYFQIDNDNNYLSVVLPVNAKN